MPANVNSNATPKSVLLLKKVKSRGQLRSRSVPLAHARENASQRSASSTPPSYRPRMPATPLASSESFSAMRWAPKHGTIVIKVSVPCMDDLWKFKVAENVTLERLTRRAEAKIGFPVAFSYAYAVHCERAVRTEEAFRDWVDTRIQKGINTPLIARVRVWDCR